VASEHVARLIAEADACAADATRLRAVAAQIDRRPLTDDLLTVAARLDESAARLRTLAGRMR
jgi:hypothetical protein